MTEPSTLPRPRQVTLAAWMVISGSLLLVATAFERVASLHKLETRDAIGELLTEPAIKGLGLDVEGALTILRTFAMVTAGCAAAAAILGYHVLKRNRGARLALTLVAVPLFLSGLVLGGFLSALVGVSAVMLWLEPSRDWFNGIAPTPRTTPAPPDKAPPSPAPPPSTGPRPQQGFGALPPQQPTHQPPQNVPPQYPPPQYPPPPPGARPYAAPPPFPPAYAASWPHPAPQVRERPGAVLVACIVTWVCCALAVLIMVGTAAVVAANPDVVIDEMHRQDPNLTTPTLTEQSLQTLTYITAGLVVLWSVAAIVLAVLVLRRIRWARVALLASAGGAAGLCLAGSFQSFVLAVPLLACTAAFSLLLRPDVRDWFAQP